MTKDEMRAGLLKAYELLSYGVPDPGLTNSVSAPAWRKECDEWLDQFPPSKLPPPQAEPTAPQPVPCTCTTYCIHSGYPDAPIRRGVYCREKSSVNQQAAPTDERLTYVEGRLVRAEAELLKFGHAILATRYMKQFPEPYIPGEPLPPNRSADRG